MLPEKIRTKLAKDDDAGPLVRRLLTEYGLTRWKRYVFAFALMGLGAACTALTAYMIRLKPEDFDDPGHVATLAKAGHLEPAEFTRRFAPIVRR